MQRTIALVVLTLALAATASQPLVAADQTVEETGAPAPVFVGTWTGPGSFIVVVIVPLPAEAPEPKDDESADDDGKDKNGVILDDGAPF